VSQRDMCTITYKHRHKKISANSCSARVADQPAHTLHKTRRRQDSPCWSGSSCAARHERKLLSSYGWAVERGEASTRSSSSSSNR
jgi:hypothetical protein